MPAYGELQSLRSGNHLACRCLCHWYWVFSLGSEKPALRLADRELMSCVHRYAGVVGQLTEY